MRKYFLSLVFGAGIFSCACQSQESRHIGAGSLFHHGLWKSSTTLQLVFTQPLADDAPVSFSYVESCRSLEKNRRQNISAYINTHYADYHEGYKILQQIFSVDRDGNCTDTVLLKLEKSKDEIK